TGLSLDEAQRVAADFLNAWVNGQYDVMYGLLAVNSRDAFAFADFQAAYSDAEKTVTLLPEGDNKSYALTNAILQGATASVAYDMTFKTRSLGSFTDPGRVLTLVTTPDGWRVAWSPGDIFAEMRDGAVLRFTHSQPTRASIYDRDGQVIADEQGEARTITLLTKSYPTGNPEDCFRELARVFKVRTAEQMNSLYGGDHTGRDFAFDIGTLNIDTFLTERPVLEKVCTLQYAVQPVRRYLAGGLAPHIVGYVGPIPAERLADYVSRGYSPDAIVGVDGIEKYWEDTLAGHGSATLALESGADTIRVLAKRDAVPAQAVYLTIDRKLQTAVQDMFKDAFDQAQWNITATGAAAIVMDVHTGELLAIASYPDFNVDAFNPASGLPDAADLIAGWLNDPHKPTFNRATLGQYPAGSIFKIFSMAAAADSGIFNLNTLYTCTGTWHGTPLGDRERRDWISYGAPYQHGTITLKQALTGSCDTYFWNLGWTLNGKDPQLLVKYAQRFGLGSPTGINGVAEASGNLPDPANYQQMNGVKWRGSDALNLVIGQGDVLVTPLQIVRAIAAVANGGTLYEPLVVEKTGLIDEISYTAKPTPNGRLNLKPEVLKGIQDAMCNVTTDPTLGTATFVYKGFKGAVVCGKTGTAQAGGPYDAPHAWFGAFAGKTVDNPDIAVVVVVEHSNEGSFVAAPIVRRIIETYYGLDITPWPVWWFGGNGGAFLHSGD
ncbi:MAG TPA: penicillin-binding transpeptidase domain-containing protein, partial [Aggregatilineales bacterium]|nr:penicillin-binding transpeptidase domain-containing protein [Aggregatilineales bacterium]